MSYTKWAVRMIGRGESLVLETATEACLDRQIWHMLAGRQAHLALGGEAAKRIDPRYGPFAALRDGEEDAARALLDLSRGPGDELWLVEPEPVPARPGFASSARRRCCR